MDEAGDVTKLEIKNRKRLKDLSSNLNLDTKKQHKALKKRDFESYERKKLERFSWQKP